MNQQEMARKTAELLIAWADGKHLQHFQNGEWHDWESKVAPKIWNTEEWRIGTGVKTAWYRIAVFRDLNEKFYLVCCTPSDTEENIEKYPLFVKWATDKIYVELPENED